MPQGRGSNARRKKYQKDNQDTLDMGAIKLILLYERWAKAKPGRRRRIGQ